MAFCPGQNSAVIGKEAKIKGNLVVNSVSIEGSIQGNITAKDRIEMKSSARVTGDIKSKRLSVEDGVTFVGRSEVNPSGIPIPPQTDAASATSGNGGADMAEATASAPMRALGHR
jgi:cytoskeletal protein CcmA (bactofilin family)